MKDLAVSKRKIVVTRTPSRFAIDRRSAASVNGRHALRSAFVSRARARRGDTLCRARDNRAEKLRITGESEQTFRFELSGAAIVNQITGQPPVDSKARCKPQGQQCRRDWGIVLLR